jgi:hypothetical protein
MSELQRKTEQLLLKAGARVRNLGDVRWLSTEDGKPGKGTGRHIAAFIIDGERVSAGTEE